MDRLTPIESASDEPILLLEYQRVYTEIMDMQRKSETLFGFGITVVGASAIYGAKDELSGIYSLATIFILGLILYIITCYSVIMSLGGYKRYLEDLINSRVRRDLLVWETYIAKPLLHKSPYMYILWGMMMIFLPLAFFVQSHRIDDYGKGWISWIYHISVVVLASLCIASAIRLMKLSDVAYEIAKTKLG